MSIVNKKEPLLLVLGDLLALALSLFLTLLLRYLEMPSKATLAIHLVPFIIIFIYSIISFYAVGLYGKRLLVIRRGMPGTVIRTQIANGLLAVALFYFIPAFTVTPKLNLLIYSILSMGLLITWRVWSYRLLSSKRRYRAIIIGQGSELYELANEVNNSTRSALECAHIVDLAKVPTGDLTALLHKYLDEKNVTHIIADIRHPSLVPLMPDLYMRSFPKIRLIDFHEFYEEMFDRIPLSSMTYGWVLEHISPAISLWYDVLKRAMDIVLSLILAVFAIITYPLVSLAIKLEDGGKVFISQERIGEGNKIMKVLKYRTMKVNDGGKWLTEGDERVTKVGRFLRRARIDELPQIMSVVKGDMSLIGPRPDIVDLSETLEKEIPYHHTRTIIRPGLSGWAQVNQDKPPQSIEESKLRLSYDLYYIKNRSFSLDLRIALRTIRTLLSRVGM